MYPGRHAETQPDAAAIIMAGSGEIVTYGELDARSNRLAHLLREAGLRRGDHLALFMENHPRFMEVVWAGLRSGLYVTAVNRYLTAPELAYIVEDCGARALVTSAALAETATAIDPSCAARLDVRLMTDGAVDGFDGYEDAIAAQSPAPIDDESSGTTMLYSSGTTGRPKGILRPLPTEAPGDMDRRLAGLGALYRYRQDMTYLSPAPMYHSAPLAFVTSTHRYGGTVVMMEHFDPARALGLIEAHRVTHSQWVPTMFVRMLRLPDEVRAGHDLSSHEVAIHAAAPCPASVKAQMIEWWGPILYEYYAGTEGNGSTYINSEEWLAHPGSVGRSRVAEVHITDEDGNEVPAGTEGTIWFGGGPAFEYHGDPDKTAASRHPNGWSTLGDVGYVDEDGWLYLTDRKAYMIISGGVNIYPREVEDVLIEHPAVEDVAVFGVPNDDLGEEVKAVVQPVPGAEPGPRLADELIAFTRGRLAHFKCPRSVDFEAELPRLPTGKLYKRILRDRYWGKAHTTIV